MLHKPTVLWTVCDDVAKMDDVLELILRKCDAMSSSRLVRASKSLWFKYKYESLFWISLEADLLFQGKYMAFRSVNKHLGCRRRVLKWSTYLESPCSKCDCSLFHICTGTFPINLKLCNNCQSAHLMTEEAISRYIPYYLVLEVRRRVKYCWIVNIYNRRVMAFYRPHVLAYLELINFF